MIRFRFSGGDGDQSWFGQPFVAERVEQPWFPAVIPRGSAYLLKVLSGPHKGEYLAITSRMVASLDEQLRTREFVSVVVHRLINPGAGFQADKDHLPAIGMAAAQAVRPTGPAILTNPWTNHPFM